jgi:hypothetical protein
VFAIVLLWSESNRLSHLDLATQHVGFVDEQPIKDKGIVSRIISEMKPPSKKGDEGADSHYRCEACLLVREDERKSCLLFDDDNAPLPLLVEGTGESGIRRSSVVQWGRGVPCLAEISGHFPIRDGFPGVTNSEVVVEALTEAQRVAEVFAS